MEFFQDNNEERVEINIISLIDVVLLLVIFMMLSSHFIRKSGLKIDLPQAKAREISKAKDYVITVSRKGKMRFMGNPVTMESLKTRLESLFGPGTKGKTVIIKADKKVTHGKVVAVMDLIKETGFEHLGIATEHIRRR
ncbi:MAG: ExbD/TolR family protein [bacterium]